MPSQAELAFQQFKQRRAALEGAAKQDVLAKYGNAAEAPSEEVLALQARVPSGGWGAGEERLGLLPALPAPGAVATHDSLPRPPDARPAASHHSPTPPCPAPQATEAYAEYDAHGRLLRGQEVKARPGRWGALARLPGAGERWEALARLLGSAGKRWSAGSGWCRLLA